MDVFEAIHGRRSIRAYQEEDVSDAVIDKLTSAATMAPSAGNLQAWELIIVRDRERKVGLMRAALAQEFVAEARLVIVICANELRSAQRYGRRGASLYCIQDCAAATQNLLLAAHALGLGACWVGSFDESAVSRLLGIPRGVRPVTLVPIGYPAEEPELPPRLPLERVVHLERFRTGSF